MRSITQIFYSTVYKSILQLYLKTDSNIRFEGFNLKVYKHVFHPKLFFSTTYFYDFIKTQHLSNKSFLEIGCGSGILSLLALKKGAHVTAIDIDSKAIENTKLNFEKNFKEVSRVTILQSDLYDSLPKKKFDIIVINPPYYFKKPIHVGQQAWYCGENGEYFEKLFFGLSHYIHSTSIVYMILEENCEIDRIKKIAKKNNFVFHQCDERKIKWETNFIFKIIKL